MREAPRMPLLCIYHGSNCDDGFAAAWAVRNARPDTEFYAGVHGAPPPPCVGRDVLLVDFSYKRDVMEQLTKTARSVVVLDHHDTAEKELRPLLKAGTIGGEFDMTRSGAVMAWQYYNAGEMPPLLAYIQDRDLWRKKLPDTDAVTFGIRTFPKDFGVWDALMFERTVNQIRDIGMPVHKFFRSQVDYAKGTAHLLRFTKAGLDAPCVTTHMSLASEVAGELHAQHEAPFAAVYSRSKHGWTFSLRCGDDYDVGALAVQYGGGGHKKAAGFTISALEEL